MDSLEYNSKGVQVDKKNRCKTLILTGFLTQKYGLYGLGITGVFVAFRRVRPVSLSNHNSQYVNWHNVISFRSFQSPKTSLAALSRKKSRWLESWRLPSCRMVQLFCRLPTRLLFWWGVRENHPTCQSACAASHPLSMDCLGCRSSSTRSPSSSQSSPPTSTLQNLLSHSM